MFKSLFSSPSKSPRKAEKSEKPEKTDKSEGGSGIRRDETDPPLHAAIRAHDHKDAKKLAEKGGEEAVLALDRQGRTSLHVAGEVGEVESLKLVIAHVPRGKLTEAVNTKDRMGNTPLFYACVTGSKKCVQELLRLGADVSVANIINETVLHAIFRAPFMTKSHVSVVQELLTQTKKISLNSVNDENNTVLQIACSKGAYDIAVLLLRAGADATVAKAGDPPLFWAVVAENPALVRELLEHGADVSQPNAKGQTLMDIINPKCEIYRIVKKHLISRPGGVRKLQFLSETAIVAKSVKELPPELQKNVEVAGLTAAQVDANWEVFVAIVHLVAKKRIASSMDEAAQFQERKVRKNKEEQAALHAREVDELTCRMLTAGDPRKVFKKMRVAGQGGFGMVFQGIGPDKRPWAIKRMPHSSEKEKLANLREAQFLKRCHHNNICTYKATYECVAQHELYLIMELLEGGTLDESVGNNAKHRFEEKHLAYTARELLLGLQYLHEEGIVHRDLKSANVMFSINGDIKIIDFGSAVAITDSAHAPTDMVGSPYWMPPEMVLRRPHGPPADIWSFAVCLLELANHRPPTNVSVMRHLFMIGTGHAPSLDQPEKFTQLMRDFLTQCLVIEPSQRPRAIVLLQHSWLSSSAATKADMSKLLRSIFMVRSYQETAL